MQFQRCPNCRDRNDVSFYVHGQLARCQRCGLRFTVDREALVSNPNEGRPGANSPAPEPAHPDAPAVVPEARTDVPSLLRGAEFTVDHRSPPKVDPVKPKAASPAPERLPRAPVIVPPKDPITSGQLFPTPADRPSPPARQVAPPTARTETGNEPKPNIPGYDCKELLGRGGMGEVWKARQHSLDRIVAIKLLSPTLAVEPDFVRRFERESSALAALAHPYIVAIYDRGSANGYWYFVMEFVEGRSLRDRVSEVRPPRNEMLRLLAQVARAIDYAHRKGVIHRDLKPENVLLDHSGNVKVADFGLAGMSEVGRSSLTMTAVAMGTAHYMAPEQRRDAKNVDGRADLYSLGVMLYEMLCHEIPQGKFPTPREKVPDIDERLDTLIMRMLDQDPDRRPSKAAEVADVLEAVIGPPAQKAIALAPPAPTPARPLRSVVRQVRENPNRQYMLIGAALLLVLVIGVAIARVGGGSHALAARVDRLPTGKGMSVTFGAGPAETLLAMGDGWTTTSEGDLARAAEHPTAKDSRLYVQPVSLDFDNAAMEADVEVDGHGTSDDPAFAELVLSRDDRQVAVRLAMADDASSSLLYSLAGKGKQTKVDGSHDTAVAGRQYHLEVWVVNGHATAMVDHKQVAAASVPGLSGLKARAGFGCQTGRCRFSNVRLNGAVAESVAAAGSPK